MRIPSWSPRSLDDLRRIQDYFDAIDEDLSERIIRSIRSTTNRLIDHPRSGSPIGDSGFRKLIVPRYAYVIIYRVIGDDTLVFRVRHMAEDWHPA